MENHSLTSLRDWALKFLSLYNWKYHSAEYSQKAGKKLSYNCIYTYYKIEIILFPISTWPHCISLAAGVPLQWNESHIEFGLNMCSKKVTELDNSRDNFSHSCTTSWDLFYSKVTCQKEMWHFFPGCVTAWDNFIYFCESPCVTLHCVSRVLTLGQPHGVSKLYGLENNSVHRNAFTEIICCPVGGT